METATATLIARPGQTLMFTPSRRMCWVFPDETGRSECDCILVPTVMRDHSLSTPAGWLCMRPDLERRYPHPEFGRADTALRQYLDLLFAANMQNRSSLTAAAARRAPAVLLAEMVALQHAFQRVQGATPRAVLGQLRLELARQRLADPNDTCTVTMVAPDCGIADFGRFAAAYAARYGELPS